MSQSVNHLIEEVVGTMTLPTNSAGAGHIAGIGVGPDGEPGVDMARRKKKRKSEQTEDSTPSEREWGTDSLTDIYKKDTPGQLDELFTELLTVHEAWEKITKCQQCRKSLSPREQKLGFRVCDKCVGRNKGGVWGNDRDDEYVDEASADCGCGGAQRNPTRTVNECIGVTMTLGDKIILAKNRDRSYHPSIEVVHTIVDGTEIAYFHDITTDWSEGMNEHGIGIVNTALLIGYDEQEKKIIKDKGKKSKDGARIRYALSKKTIDDVVKVIVSANGGVKGHTIVASRDAVYTIELTSKHKAHIIKHKPGTMIVRTNHGDQYPDAGYTQKNKPDDYASSLARRKDAIILVKQAKRVEDVLPALRRQLHDAYSNLNVFRDTDRMKTSSQLLFNITDLVLHLQYVDSKIDGFHGLRNSLPKGYSPKIRVKIEPVKLPTNNENLQEKAEYEGREVTLNDPFRTPDGPKKFAVYVKNDKGNVIKLGFGDPNMEIKRDDPDRRKNFRARHNCDDPGPKWKARYWSCQWGWSANKLDETLTIKQKEIPMANTPHTLSEKIVNILSGDMLSEKFFDGYDGHGYMGYTEVWIDPSGSEIAEASRKRQTKVNANFTDAPAPTSYYCRGWLTDKHLFIWSADSDDHMDVAKAVQNSAKEKKMSVNFSNALAIELNYFPTPRVIGIHMASWSNPRRLTDTQAAEIAQKHPSLKGYKIIPVDTGKKA